MSGDTGIELVVEGLSFPTSLTFDKEGVIYVAESGLPFGGAAPGGRIWCVAADGTRTLVAEHLRHPVNGLVYHDGGLYVSEGGHPSRISRIELDGRQTVLVDNLPGPGNYHTNTVAFGPDGKMYFSQGAMTNTGIVGLDAYEMGWLRRLPHAYDIPGYDVVLTGANAETPNPLVEEPGARAFTGAFSAFGTATEAGQRIPGQLPCTAAVMRCNPDGSELELVAWGIRNAFAIGFLPDGRLLAVDQGADDRGSRPVGNVPDLLLEVQQNAWYGWPDFIGGVPITDARFLPTRGAAPEFLLANHDELPAPEKPLLEFPSHVAAVKFDVAPASVRRYAGQIYIALFGDEAPMCLPAGGPRVGRSIGRIDPQDWSLHEVAPDGLNALNRPIDVRFGPTDGALYVLDFGYFEMREGGGLDAEPRSGKVWRVTGI
ncbi:MAG: sugar dehydrogenase [Chloroflexota bacterium]|nr:sugar dehydrogenase [Chloroflexota bacterium]